MIAIGCMLLGPICYQDWQYSQWRKQQDKLVQQMQENWELEDVVAMEDMEWALNNSTAEEQTDLDSSEATDIDSDSSSVSECEEDEDWAGEDEEETPILDMEDVDCVIEIPSIGLKNAVITGERSMQHLEQFYMITATSSMKYGMGSYVVCGHQSFVYGRGCNRLEELRCGDDIYIYDKLGNKNRYRVEEVQTNQTTMAIEDFSSDTNRLTIYTCMKQTTRPKPYFVVRATKQ